MSSERTGSRNDQTREPDLTDLVSRVAPPYPAINAYLDATNDAERAVPYGDLAQAALEARAELERRQAPT